MSCSLLIPGESFKRDVYKFISFPRYASLTGQLNFLLRKRLRGASAPLYIFAVLASHISPNLNVYFSLIHLSPTETNAWGTANNLYSFVWKSKSLGNLSKYSSAQTEAFRQMTTKVLKPDDQCLVNTPEQNMSLKTMDHFSPVDAYFPQVNFIFPPESFLIW